MGRAGSQEKLEVTGKSNKHARGGRGTGARALSGDQKDRVTAGHLVFK